MNIRKYETRLDGNGFVMLNLVFSKYIPEIENNFTNSEKVYQLCRTMEWDTYSEEHVFLLSFNMKFRLKAFFEIGIGNNDTCLVDRRGIAQKILLSNAAKMIMVHNHPSGDPTPSKEDLNVSNELKKLGEKLGVSEDTIRRDIQKGKYPTAKKENGKWVIYFPLGKVEANV